MKEKNRYYDTQRKTNIWLLDKLTYSIKYADGANIRMLYLASDLYTRAYKIPVDSVYFSTIHRGDNRYVYIYSSIRHKPDPSARKMKNVVEWLTKNYKQQ